MKQNLNVLARRVEECRGCLKHHKLKTSYRRYLDDEDPFKIENVFIADKAKILSSKSWRRTSWLTQVFTLPSNHLIRSRSTHILEVVAISTIIAEILGLNHDLVEAAAFGHDLGHVPFGHQGEKWLAEKMNRPDFCHEKMGVIVTQHVERRGNGLNLTWHTLDAMQRHSGQMANGEMSEEARVLLYADKIAYIFADLNDIGKRNNYPLPSKIMQLANSFGATQRERTSTAIAGLVFESAEHDTVSFEKSELGLLFKQLRTEMYQLYPCVTQQNVGSILEPILVFLDSLKLGDPFLLLSLLTDQDVMRLGKATLLDMSVFNATALREIVPHLKDIGDIDLCNSDLDW